MSPAAAVLLAAFLQSSAADGRVEAASGYTKSQTYHAALRYLRVDLGYEVVERDPDAAYLLFRYTAPGRTATTNGSIEIVEAKQVVRVFVQLPQMPEYHEQVLSDGLRRKLKDEYGEPSGPKGPEEKAPREKAPDDKSPKKRDGAEPPEKPQSAPGEGRTFRLGGVLD